MPLHCLAEHAFRFFTPSFLMARRCCHADTAPSHGRHTGWLRMPMPFDCRPRHHSITAGLRTLRDWRRCLTMISGWMSGYADIGCITLSLLIAVVFMAYRLRLLIRLPPARHFAEATPLWLLFAGTHNTPLRQAINTTWFCMLLSWPPFDFHATPLVYADWRLSALMGHAVTLKPLMGRQYARYYAFIAAYHAIDVTFASDTPTQCRTRTPLLISSPISLPGQCLSPCSLMLRWSGFAIDTPLATLIRFIDAAATRPHNIDQLIDFTPVSTGCSPPSLLWIVMQQCHFGHGHATGCRWHNAAAATHVILVYFLLNTVAEVVAAIRYVNGLGICFAANICLPMLRHVTLINIDAAMATRSSMDAVCCRRVSCWCHGLLPSFTPLRHYAGHWLMPLPRWIAHAYAAITIPRVLLRYDWLPDAACRALRLLRCAPIFQPFQSARWLRHFLIATDWRGRANIAGCH